MGIVFVGVTVVDLDIASDWYQRLLGRCFDVEVNQDEVMWRLTDTAWLYLLREAPTAGHARIVLSVDDLDGALEDVASRGLVSRGIESIPSAGRKAGFTDPDPNLVELAEIITKQGDVSS